MKEKRMKEIWIEVENGEKRFSLDIDKETGKRRLTVRGDIYHFENIYSYRRYGKDNKTIKIKLTNAWKVEA